MALISREQAIRMYCGEHCGCEPNECGLTYEQDGTEECEVVRFLKSVPSAEKKGKWIKKYRGHYMCSVCGAWYKTTDEYGNIIDGDGEMKSNNYCSNCGARMFDDDTNILGKDGREKE